MSDLSVSWAVRGALLYPLPLDWNLRFVVMSTRPGWNRFQISLGVQLLAVPIYYLTRLVGNSGLNRPRHIWDFPEHPDDAGPVMASLRTTIESELAPKLEQLGSLEGYASDPRNTVLSDPTMLNEEELSCMHEMSA